MVVSVLCDYDGNNGKRGHPECQHHVKLLMMREWVRLFCRYHITLINAYITRDILMTNFESHFDSVIHTMLMNASTVV